MLGTDSYRITIDLTPSTDLRSSEITVSGYNMTPLSAEPLQARSLGQGVIRLFRDFVNPQSTVDSVHPGDDTMVSIIAIPTYYTATDVLGFVGDHYMEFITHLRILKSDKPNRFLVLLKFSDAVKAAEFQLHYDGKPFNSMEPETCHVVFVKSVVVEEPEGKEKKNNQSKEENEEQNGEKDLKEGDSPLTDDLIPFLLSDPFTGSDEIPTELPTCPVCLERLDYEVSGLLTIPCQHTFHCHCLSKWRDDTCPICRYTNDISNHQVRRSVRRLSQINSRMQPPPTDTMDKCMDCDTTDNLWVCLICGNLGCSRYAPEQHSLKHFVETGHCFAMELESSRVWDYAGDNYVHRLITNGADGKIVEFPEKTTKGKDDNEDIEYSELLLSQLISQREYYENLLHEKHQGSGMRTRRGSSVAEVSSRRMAELETSVGELTEKLNKLTNAVVPAMQRKIDMKQTSLMVASDEVRELRALNDGLSEKVEFLSAENGKLKEQNEELGEQVKDLMFYLESQEKFKDQPDEVKEGTVVMRAKPKRKPKKK